MRQNPPFQVLRGVRAGVVTLLAAACGGPGSTASSSIAGTTDGSSAGSGAGSGATRGSHAGTSGAAGATGAPNASGSADAGFSSTGSSTGASGSTSGLVSITNTFSANRTTISTSEGAPYADCDFWTYGPDCTEQSNFGYGPTKVVRLYVCLSGEVSVGSCSQQPAVTGPLSQGMLDDIDARLHGFAGSGVRLLVRFVYNFGPIGPGAMDAPIDVISGHIDQLAPILLKNKDLIFSLQAGFIGTWGEWHDSTHGDDTAAAHQVVLDKELSYFGDAFPVLVRYPGDLIEYAGSLTPVANLGLHDDYYASDGDDGGTWNPCIPAIGYCLSGDTASQLQSYASEVSATSMFTGEFGAVDAALQGCSALASTSYALHLQSLSLFPYPTAVGTELQNEGCALTFYNMVGTRIELQKATLDGAPKANGELAVGVTLINTGFGRVIRPRPASLVFVSGGQVVAQSPIALSAMDLRQLAPSATPAAQTFQFQVTLPPTFPSSGSITAALLIPDPAPSLTTLAAYALPLNSVDQGNDPVFDPTTGFNVLGVFDSE